MHGFFTAQGVGALHPHGVQGSVVPSQLHGHLRPVSQIQKMQGWAFLWWEMHGHATLPDCRAGIETHQSPSSHQVLRQNPVSWVCFLSFLMETPVGGKIVSHTYYRSLVLRDGQVIFLFHAKKNLPWVRVPSSLPSWQVTIRSCIIY